MTSFLLTVSLVFAAFASLFIETASQNPIDACWRRNANWATNRQALANCAVGFGKPTLGGRQGPIYVVTSPADTGPGTLRFGATQRKPLWITFARDMVIVLRSELVMASHKTIDGRGAKVAIANGPCIRIRHVSHVIIHGISIHDCRPAPGSDGDAIAINSATHIWIDHCHLSRCRDGLIDVAHASTAITISNNYFTQHNKVLLLGNDDRYVQDKKMRVTIAFNYFGPGLNQRMPRVRRGYAHVANNRYEKCILYAIGGSADPVIFSEGNYYVAPNTRNGKEVTSRIAGSDWKRWKWGTSKDVFMNGAFFVPSGGPPVPPMYQRGEAFPVAPGSAVPSLTSSAGPLRCSPGRVC